MIIQLFLSLELRKVKRTSFIPEEQILSFNSIDWKPVSGTCSASSNAPEHGA